MAEKKPTAAEQIAALTDQVTRLSAMVQQGPAPVVRTGAVDPKVASEKVKASHGEAKTYRATDDGTDHKEGFVPRGKTFTTTQPQGSWMEEVEEAKD